MSEEYQEVIEHLELFREESDLNKRFKEKADASINILTGEGELLVQKALLELEELNSSDLSSYHRTQLWDIISLLESMNN
jgi:uncharacterized protein (UPF0147 family)